MSVDEAKAADPMIVIVLRQLHERDELLLGRLDKLAERIETSLESVRADLRTTWRNFALLALGLSVVVAVTIAAIFGADVRAEGAGFAVGTGGAVSKVMP